MASSKTGDEFSESVGNINSLLRRNRSDTTFGGTPSSYSFPYCEVKMSSFGSRPSSPAQTFRSEIDLWSGWALAWALHTIIRVLYPSTFNFEWIFITLSNPFPETILG